MGKLAELIGEEVGIPIGAFSPELDAAPILDGTHQMAGSYPDLTGYGPAS